MTSMMSDDPTDHIERFEVCGVPMAAASHDTVRSILASSSWGYPFSINFCSTHALSLVTEDEDLRRALESAKLNLADGWPVAAVARLLRVPGFPGQIRGPDFMEGSLADPDVACRRHFFLGTTPAILDELERVIRRRFPRVNIVGMYAPPWGDIDTVLTAQTIQTVSDARPDVLWVGFGTPLQNKFIARAAEDLPVAMVAVGAAFEFMAGTKKRAPELVRRLRLEWAFRFAQEPLRLWRRYVVGTLVFAALLVQRRPRRIGGF